MRFIFWRVHYYNWCAGCQQKVAEVNSELCPSCKAVLDLELKELLKN